MQTPRRQPRESIGPRADTVGPEQAPLEPQTLPGQIMPRAPIALAIPGAVP